MTLCMTVLGPLARVFLVVWGMYMGPLPITKMENGSEFAPTMGLDGAVCRYGSDWYDSEPESKAGWPFDGVEGH